jgi:hypothetical protein
VLEGKCTQMSTTEKSWHTAYQEDLVLLETLTAKLDNQQKKLAQIKKSNKEEWTYRNLKVERTTKKVEKLKAHLNATSLSL